MGNKPRTSGEEVMRIMTLARTGTSRGVYERVGTLLLRPKLLAQLEKKLQQGLSSQ